MLTPRFSLSQDEEFLYINIIAPYIKVAQSECNIDGNEFYFCSQPYFLRLHLPGRILDDHLSTSHYDVDSGQLTVRVAKETKGEVFDNLDMLTNLLTPRKVVNEKEEIEVIDGLVANEEDEFDWHFEFPLAKSSLDSIIVSAHCYGFANRKSNALNDLLKTSSDVIDLKDPDSVPVAQRRLLREQQEKEHFQCEHYLADLFDDDLIQEVISPNYEDLTGTLGVKSDFTEAEKSALLQLPRREYILDSSQLKTAYLGLVDLVFAYAYSFRFSKGEHNVESDWIICKLSATLSWFDTFENLHDVIVSCARRSLCFPLYRNWTLFHRVFNDVKTIFLNGKPQILKCLLGIHRVLAESDSRYPLNDLYITDYCVWLQSAESHNVESLAKTLGVVSISKFDMDLRLDEMEADARTFVDDCESEEHNSGGDDKGGDIERLANALSDIVQVKDVEVVDSDDDDSEEDDDDDTDDDCSEGSSSSDDHSGTSDSCESDNDSSNADMGADGVKDESNDHICDVDDYINDCDVDDHSNKCDVDDYINDCDVDDHSNKCDVDDHSNNCNVDHSNN